MSPDDRTAGRAGRPTGRTAGRARTPEVAPNRRSIAESRPDPERRGAPAARPAGVASQQATPDPTRADALSRIAAKVSGRRDLTGLFDDIIDEAFALFGVDRAGLWVKPRSRWSGRRVIRPIATSYSNRR